MTTNNLNSSAPQPNSNPNSNPESSTHPLADSRADSLADSRADSLAGSLANSRADPSNRGQRILHPKALHPKSVWPIALLAMGVILAGVGWKAYQSLSQVSEPAPEEIVEVRDRLPVRVIAADQRLAQQWIFDDGTVWPLQRHILNFDADGDIQSIVDINGRDLRAGDYVNAGQVLATIDSRKQRSAVETAEADLEVSIQQLSQAKAGLIQTQAGQVQAESDLDLAKSELERYRGLFEEGIVSESDRDVFANRVVQAEAALLRAEQDVRSAEDNIRAATATIKASEARLRESMITVEDTQLASPVSGVVAYINIREGEHWSQQRFDSRTAQSLIETAAIVVVNPQKLEVELELQAQEAQAIQTGQRAYVVLEEQVSYAQATGNVAGLLDIAQQQGSLGTVFAVSPTQTPGGRGTKISIRNFTSVERLQIGARAYVWIEAATSPNAIMIPIGSLVTRGQQAYVFVVNETSGTVERRQVDVGIEGLDGLEVTRGLEPGDLVVTEGINRLVDGTPVEVVAREVRP